MRHTAVLVMAALVMLMTSGCKTPEPVGPLVEPTVALELGYSPGWASDLNLPEGHHVEHAVVLGDLLVMIESPSNLVVAVELSDGDIRWTTKVGSLLDQLFEPVRVDDQIMVSSETQLFALDAQEGDVLRRLNLPSPVTSKPAAWRNLMIYGGIQGEVYAIHAESGMTQWRYRVSGQLRTHPVMLGDVVFAADSAGAMTMLEADSGELRWRRYAFEPILAQPTGDDLTVYVASDDRTLYAKSKDLGLDRWVYRAQVPLRMGPTLLDETLFLPIPGQNKVALNTVTGEVRWRIPTNYKPVSLVRPGFICFNAPDELVLLDADSGQVLRRASVQPLSHVLLADDGDLVLISPEGRLRRISPAASLEPRGGF